MLVFGYDGGRPVHAVVARDAGSGLCYVVTAYRPDPDLSERRFQGAERAMTCVLCKSGDTRSGRVTVTLQRGETTVLVKDVPADVCSNCGEYYLDEVVSRRVYGQAEDATRRHAEVGILRYAA